ncbi:receptor expression-enhancing protein 5-like [Diretmus argenteus]
MYSQLKERFDKFMSEKNVVTDLLTAVEETTGIKRSFMGPGILAGIVLYILVVYGTALFTNLVGFTYPAYLSIKAIESDKKEDDTQWLTYWIVYGAFSIVEEFSDMFLYWLPFYYFGKSLYGLSLKTVFPVERQERFENEKGSPDLKRCVFLVWCMSPVSWNGSDVLYNRLIKPFYIQHQQRMDDVVADLNVKAKSMAESATKEGSATRSIQKWFVKVGVEELNWPAQRPDLNPIEHLQDELENQNSPPNISTRPH